MSDHIGDDDFVLEVVIGVDGMRVLRTTPPTPLAPDGPVYTFHFERRHRPAYRNFLLRDIVEIGPDWLAKEPPLAAEVVEALIDAHTCGPAPQCPYCGRGMRFVVRRRGDPRPSGSGIGIDAQVRAECACWADLVLVG